VKNHLPYNVLLIATVAAVGLMAIFNLYVRQSGFAVHVGYALPQPPAAEAAPLIQAQSSSIAQATPPQILPPVVTPHVPVLPPAAPQNPPAPQPPEPSPPIQSPLPPPQEEPEIWEWEWEEQEVFEREFYQPEQEAVHFPIDLNAATSEQLQLVRGIGPATAQRIIDFRWQIGGFTHLSQLLEVSGIGPATFERMAPYFFVPGQAEWEQWRWEQEWAEYLYLLEQYNQQQAQWQQEVSGL